MLLGPTANDGAQAGPKAPVLFKGSLMIRAQLVPYLGESSITCSRCSRSAGSKARASSSTKPTPSRS